MKKVLVFLGVMIIIICMVSYTYINYKNNYQAIQKQNSQYEKYIGKEIYGTELTTIMNKTIDINTKNEILKDSKGKYLENDTNSIQIQIKMLDKDLTYDMESFDQKGMNQFIYYYGTIKFKGMKIEYHEKTRQVKYLLFEQITT